MEVVHVVCEAKLRPWTSILVQVSYYAASIPGCATRAALLALQEYHLSQLEVILKKFSMCVTYCRCTGGPSVLFSAEKKRGWKKRRALTALIVFELKIVYASYDT